MPSQTGLDISHSKLNTNMRRDILRAALITSQSCKDATLSQNLYILILSVKWDKNKISLMTGHLTSTERFNPQAINVIYTYIYIYEAPILDVSRSHTTTQHSR